MTEHSDDIRLLSASWRRHLDAANLADRTIGSYMAAVEQLTAHVETERRHSLRCAEIGREDIEASVTWHRAADALRAGLSNEMIRRAVAQLESELDALNRHRAELDAWADQNAAQSERTANLARLAEIAHKRLDTMSDVERRAVLDLLDVRVTVLDAGDRRRSPQIRIEGHVPELWLLDPELWLLDGNLIDAELKRRVEQVTGLPFAFELAVA